MPNRQLWSIAALLFAAACGDNSPPNRPDAKSPDAPDAGPVTGLELPGLDAAVDVVIDDRGVPHIYATTIHDAMMVEGYLMAKDRFAQMEFLRRGVVGRLAAVVGASQLDADRQSRFLGFERTGREIYAGLAADAPSRLAAEAFVAGVNHWITSVAQAPGYTPPRGNEAIALVLGSPNAELWEPADIFALARYQSFSLSFDAEADIGRSQALGGVLAAFPAGSGNAALAARSGAYADLFTDRPARAVSTRDGFPTAQAAKPKAATKATRSPGRGAPTPAVAGVDPRAVDAAAAYFEAFDNNPLLRRDPHVGSNSWVVSGDKTASGNPILSNDPHLSLIAPPVWWYVHLNTAARNGEGNIDAQGVAFAGLPGVVLGFNRKLAWGATTTGYDVTDVYAERVTFAAGRPSSVTFRGAEVALELVPEVIDIAGQASETFPVFIVPHHGPLIPTSIMPPSSGNVGSALSVKYTGQTPSDELAFFNGLLTAETFADAEAAQTNFKVGSQNFSFVSATEGIRWSSVSRVPQRAAMACTFAYTAGGVPQGFSPLFILDGQSGAFEWEADLAPQFVPQDVNPATGYIATANQDNVGVTFDANPCNDAHYLGGDFDVGYRQARIRQRLDAAVGAGDVTTEDMIALQGETTSVLGESMRTQIIASIDHALGDTSDDPALAAAMTAIGPSGALVLADAKTRLQAWSLQTPHGVGATAGQEVADSVGTTIWNAFLTRLAPLMLGDETGLIARRPGSLQTARVLEWAVNTPATLATYRASYGGDATYNDSVLWDDLATTGVLETRDERVVRAIVAAYTYLTTTLGADRDQWRWGRLHAVRFNQLVPSLNGVDEVSIPPSTAERFPRHGDLGAVDPGNYGMYDTTNFSFTSGASQRLVVEMTSSGPLAFNAIPGGQSEDPDSAHHADEAELWRVNQQPPLRYEQADVDAHAAERLRFIP